MASLRRVTFPLPLRRQRLCLNHSIRTHVRTVATVNAFQNAHNAHIVGAPSTSTSTTSTPTPTSTRTTSSSPTSSSPDTSPSPSESLLPSLRYHIHRTPSQQLPVYQNAKRGGNLHLTTVRKVSGDSGALREDLLKELRLPEEKARVNRLNGHVIIKAWVKEDVKRFLEERRF